MGKELNEQELSAVTGGYETKETKSSERTCPFCGGTHIEETFKNRSYIKCTCQECGCSWDRCAV